MNVLEVIKTRRSVRSYTVQPIEWDDLNKILESAIATPSGKNGKPWKFKVITEKKQITKIAKLSLNYLWMKTAVCLIMVFLDKERSYDYTKDAQSCGAVMQNIMLSAHSIGIGSCWIGDVLGESDEIKNQSGIINNSLELMGIITLGYQKTQPTAREQKSIEDFLL